MVQGPKLATILSQVKKLDVTVLVLGQKKSAPFISWCVISIVRSLFPHHDSLVPIITFHFCRFVRSLCGPSRSEELVNRCINGADCLTIGVRKQSNGVSGYLINTRWQKNFWLLA